MQRELRLTNREDFAHIYRRGTSVANFQFVLYFLSNPHIEQFRLGISVSKKVGNAVIRNRIRRVVKEVTRSKQEIIVPQMDLILIARKPAANLNYQEIEKSMMHLFYKAKLLKRIKK